MVEPLYELREWLFVPDAAAHLSEALGREVTEPDVLRYGLDGRLTLSLRFVSEVPGRFGRVVPREKAKVCAARSGARLQRHFEVSESDVLQLDEPKKIVFIAGVWNLVMLGSARLALEERYHSLVGRSGVVLERFAWGNEIFVNRHDGTWCHLHKLGDEDTWDVDDWQPAQWPYAGSVLVVRTSALDALTSRVTEPKLAHEEPSALGPAQTVKGAAEPERPHHESAHMGGPWMAAWLKAEMAGREHMTRNRLHELSTGDSSGRSLDRKTINKVLDDGLVRRASVEKLIRALSEVGPPITMSDVPIDIPNSDRTPKSGRLRKSRKFRKSQ